MFDSKSTVCSCFFWSKSVKVKVRQYILVNVKEPENTETPVGVPLQTANPETPPTREENDRKAPNKHTNNNNNQHAARRRHVEKRAW